MNINKLQYITQDFDKFSHIELAARACEAGVEWIQLRMKNKPLYEVEKVAHQVREICNTHNAIFILNDYVELAKKVKADGIHLGKKDMNPKEARKILGEDFIIGGTANSFKDILKLVEANVDYIGLGPYRFTSTKENLSPILGLQGYQRIMYLCKQNYIEIPIIAIGGITAGDVALILQTGVYGIAISSAITYAEEPLDIVKKIKEIV